MGGLFDILEKVHGFGLTATFGLFSFFAEYGSKAVLAVNTSAEMLLMNCSEGSRRGDWIS